MEYAVIRRPAEQARNPAWRAAQGPVRWAAECVAGADDSATAAWSAQARGSISSEGHDSTATKGDHMSDDLGSRSADAEEWRIREVAHAAMDLPLEQQSPRLRAAIARLLSADSGAYPTGASRSS